MRQIPLRLWLLALLSGALQILPFPIAGPCPLWRTAFCWLALVPLLVSLLGESKSGRALTWGQCALLGYASGIVWYLGNCYWVYTTMYLYGGMAKPSAFGILLLFCLYLGLYHALFAAVTGLLRNCGRMSRSGALIAAPFVWVAVELARARITGFPWDQLGVSQVDNILLTKAAPIAGVYGMSFVIVLVNVHLAAWFIFSNKISRRQAAGVGLLLIVCLEIGGNKVRHLHFEPRSARARQLAAATLLQENLGAGPQSGPPQSIDQMLSDFSQRSERPVPISPLQSSVVIWPESPAPFQSNDPRYRDALSKLAQRTNAAVISGNLGVLRDDSSPRGYRLYNSTLFVAPDGQIAGRYDKMHLVPFGEYVPFKTIFSFASSLTEQVGQFDPGTQRTLFSTGGHKYGVFICYESIFADEVRQFVKQGADVLVNISDDGWYGDTSAPWQHLNQARMRAIENQRWLLRDTNTGITAAIDPEGRVMAQASRHVRKAIAVGFNYYRKLTFYTKYGDVFAWLCVLVTLTLCLLAAFSPLCAPAKEQRS